MKDYTRKLMIYGSGDVIQAWIKIRYNHINKVDMINENVLDLYGEFILAIRNDLGHKNNGINAKDILKLFVNDID